MRRLWVLIILISWAAQVGCYNTYNVTIDELAKAAEGGSDSVVVLNTADGEPIDVTVDSKIGVTDKEGSFHKISPFNFTLAGGQLVAPDEDFLIRQDAIETGTVKTVSGTKTVLLVALGVGALVGAGAYITLTAPKRQEF